MDLQYYKDRKEKRQLRERERRDCGLYRRQCERFRYVPPLSRWARMLQRNRRRANMNTGRHSQTHTVTFFCMAGSTCRGLQRGQRADGAFEVGGFWNVGKVDEVCVCLCVCVKCGECWHKSLAEVFWSSIWRWYNTDMEKNNPAASTISSAVVHFSWGYTIWLSKSDVTGIKKKLP